LKRTIGAWLLRFAHTRMHMDSMDPYSEYFAALAVSVFGSENVAMWTLYSSGGGSTRLRGAPGPVGSYFESIARARSRTIVRSVVVARSGARGSVRAVWVETTWRWGGTAARFSGWMMMPGMSLKLMDMALRSGLSIACVCAPARAHPPAPKTGKMCWRIYTRRVERVCIQ
jgi:hypothetical protein